MNLDERMLTAWRGQTRHDLTLARLTERVRRQRRRQRFQRGLEVALSLVAIVIFGHALLSGTMAPAHWLILPFFAVFLPTIWALTLRGPRRRPEDASEAPGIYARLRMAQLRAGLRDLWLARRAALALVAYAVLAWGGAMILGDVGWRAPAWLLLVYSFLWLGGTHWLNRRLRGRWLREYRSVRRVLSGVRL
jgi:predicted anti-sigma-YlaC factor YlaD